MQWLCGCTHSLSLLHSRKELTHSRQRRARLPRFAISSRCRVRCKPPSRPRALVALSALERDWHHIWHNLVECPRHRRRQDALEHFLYVATSRASTSPTHIRLSHMTQQVPNHCTTYAQGAGASNELRQDFLTFLVNPAQHTPEGTHVAVLSDVVNLVTADRAQHSAGAPAAVDASSASDTDTDLDDACYAEAVTALGLGQTLARNRKPAHATRRRRRPPRGATSTPARGDRQPTPRCPPRCRSRRRQVEAHAPTAG